MLCFKAVRIEIDQLPGDDLTCLVNLGCKQSAIAGKDQPPLVVPIGPFGLNRGGGGPLYSVHQRILRQRATRSGLEWCKEPHHKAPRPERALFLPELYPPVICTTLWRHFSLGLLLIQDPAVTGQPLQIGMGLPSAVTIVSDVELWR